MVKIHVMETHNIPSPEAFGEYLIEKGLLSNAGFARASQMVESTQAPLHKIVERLGLAKEEILLNALSKYLGIGFLSREDLPDEPICDNLFTPVYLKKHCLLPIYEDAEKVQIAFANPFDAQTIKTLEFYLKKNIKPVIASTRDIEWAIQVLYEQTDSNIENEKPTTDDVETLKNLATEQPVIRFVNRLIETAIEKRASDIHIEPQERTIQIRYRVDGALIKSDPPSPTMAPAIISRIKIMASLNIAERRLPQDGRIRTNVRGSEIDLRVSTTPSLYGESVVIRVLDKTSVILDFSELGFDDKTLERYQSLLNRPNGIILVTGPTGSGKTTTLYTSLKSLDNEHRKIFSVEDPIEYQLNGVTQIHAQPQIGFDFPRALRSILRQDPDIIMIGEIRDRETADIAIQASLTGHLVLATLHTNSAAATITRLLDMGVEDYLVASTTAGVVAQRLVRKLCTHCAVNDETIIDLIRHVNPDIVDRAKTLSPKKPIGCNVCQNTGFRGRTSILEIMPISPEIRRSIVSETNDAKIEKIAKYQGMTTMLEAGLNKALSGVTTFHEVMQIAKVD